MHTFIPNRSSCMTSTSPVSRSEDCLSIQANTILFQSNFQESSIPCESSSLTLPDQELGKHWEGRHKHHLQPYLRTQGWKQLLVNSAKTFSLCPRAKTRVSGYRPYHPVACRDWRAPRHTSPSPQQRCWRPQHRPREQCCR